MRTSSLALPVLLALLGCPGDTTLKTFTEPPVVSIDAPAPGSVIVEAVPVRMLATVTDSKFAGSLTAEQVTWTVGGAVVCEGAVVDVSGRTECTTVFVRGTTSIAITVVNPDGESASAVSEVEVLKNDAPTADIASPVAGGDYYANRLTAFDGLVADGEDPPENLTVAWTSSLDGALAISSVPGSDGKTAGTAYLTPGEHQITLTVTDSTGRSASDQETIEVAVGTEPTVEILTPGTGDVLQDDLVEFLAAVDDGEDAPEALDLVWESDVDGVLSTNSASSDGLASFIYDPLTPGLHTITLTATDTDGLSAIDSVTVYVNTAPEAPLIHLEPSPAHSDAPLTVVFDSPSYDADGDPITYDYYWSQNGVDSGFTTNPLPASATIRGDVWTVYVVPDDGSIDGPAGTDTVTIENSTPTVAAVTIDPAVAYTKDTLTAVASGWADADGDAETYTYAWSVNGGVLYGETRATLSGAPIEKGDTVIVTLTPIDAYTSGTPVSSTGLTISNSVPTTPVVIVAPSSPETEDELLCWASSTDDDDDTLTYTYTWTVDGAPSGVTGDTVSAADTENGQTWECSVTVSDGTATSPAGTDSVLVDDYVNTRPDAPEIHLSPDPADTTDALTVVFDAEAYDQDADPVTYTYRWYRDGVDSGFTTNPLAPANTTHEELWTVEVTPNDGFGDGTPATASVFIDNSPPSIGSVTLSPDPAYTDDTLTATPSGWSDDDGETASYRYAWSVNGAVLAGQTSSTLSADHFVRGDQVIATITPYDGYDLGAPVASATLTITDTAPTSPVVVVTPTNPERENDLHCAATSSDEDGDTVTFSYAWSKDGVATGLTGDTVPEAYTDNGETWTCTVTATDGTDSSVASASVVVDDYVNTRPEAPTVHVSPDPPTSTDTLTVVFDAAAFDLDGDPITYSYRWTRDGVVSAVTASSVAGTYTTRGETWSVEVTPNDGHGDGSAGSASVVIGNAVPSITAAAITPEPAYTADTLTAVPSGWSDPDGDGAGYQYAWTVNGTAAGTGATLASTAFVKGDVVGLSITPWDGLGTGTAVAATAITIQNSVPTTPGIDLTPNYPEDGDNLTCSVATPSTDADGDTVSYSYSWTVDGVAFGLTTSSVSSSYTAEDQTWTCTVIASDGTGSSVAGSDSVVVSDYTSPSAPVLVEPDPYRNETTVTVVGSGEALSTITLYISTSSGVTSTTTTASASGGFSFSLTLAAGVEYTFYATSTDAHGNTSGLSNVVGTETCDPVDDYEDITTSGESCSDPIVDWGTLADNGSTVLTITGNIIEGGDEDWYYVATSDAATAGINYYRMHIELTAGSGEYAFAVYQGSCATADLECSAGGADPEGSGFTEYEDYAKDVGEGGHAIPSDTRSCGGAAQNVCDNLGGEYYIHVFRTGSGYSCQEYTLEISNGLW